MSTQNQQIDDYIPHAPAPVYTESKFSVSWAKLFGEDVHGNPCPYLTPGFRLVPRHRGGGAGLFVSEPILKAEEYNKAPQIKLQSYYYTKAEGGQARIQRHVSGRAFCKETYGGSFLFDGAQAGWIARYMLDFANKNGITLADIQALPIDDYVIDM